MQYPRLTQRIMAMQATEFSSCAIVLVSLNTPREKFWGAILAINPAGISVRGMDLNSFEDFTRQLNAGEEVTPNAVFFPMHRVERIELDARNGDIPSLSERFANRTGRGLVTLPGFEAASSSAGRSKRRSSE